MSLRTSLLLNAKNMIGWRTKRRIVVISVDDYGNVRLDSKKAREELDRAGYPVRTRFDALDSLETSEDLEILYETLNSVKDKNGRPAIFTPFAMPCNINYEKVAESGFSEYYYELLPETYDKLADRYPSSYSDAWQVWKDGLEQGLMVPQFHGREHLNLKVFEEKLFEKDEALLTSLKNRSFTSVSAAEYSTISESAAFDFWEFKENERFKNIIKDGVNAFENVFGYRPDHFNPPGGREHPVIHNTLKECGIKYIDTPLIKKEHQGRGKFKKVFNYTGKKNKFGQIYLVRNVVFEPIDDRGVDWVEFTIKQIEAAFRWNRPAIISSHRVNFCGHIDPGNREKGISALSQLLQAIVKRWSEIEFMSANELGDIIATDDGNM